MLTASLETVGTSSALVTTVLTDFDTPNFPSLQTAPCTVMDHSPTEFHEKENVILLLVFEKSAHSTREDFQFDFF
jgi:hypothetical protein